MTKLKNFKRQEQHIIQSFEAQNHEEVKRSISNLLEQLSSNHATILAKIDVSWVCNTILRWRSFLFSNYQILLNVTMPSSSTINLSNTKRSPHTPLEIFQLFENHDQQTSIIYLEECLTRLGLSPIQTSDDLLPIDDLLDEENSLASIYKVRLEVENSRLPHIVSVYPSDYFQLAIDSKIMGLFGSEGLQYKQHKPPETIPDLVHQGCYKPSHKKFCAKINEYLESNTVLIY